MIFLKSVKIDEINMTIKIKLICFEVLKFYRAKKSRGVEIGQL